MSTTEDGGAESVSGDFSGPMSVEEQTSSVAKSDIYRSDEEPRVSNDTNEPRVSKLENEENHQPSSSSISRVHGGSKKQKNRSSVAEDYDAILSSFDDFAAKGKGEYVGHGYRIGDMVWGKVKSHPWWPGHIYNEAFATASVRRSKGEGHVLVAFFGDSSYGWFDPAELIPFESNFAEKSRQTNSRAFLKAIDEAVDELSRRSSLGLACRCRNEFNFWPSSVEGYFVVDVGDSEPGVYGLRQIGKARDEFRPREMLSFVQELALDPMTDEHTTVDFIKNKAMVLACRKALFEEFDETYAQAFGTVPVRPPRPTVPVAVDPAKAPLSGRLVIAEALGKGKISAKPTKIKDQMEKDRYLFKRRDEPTQMKSKKASSGLGGPSTHLRLLDGSDKAVYSGIGSKPRQPPESGIAAGQHEPTSHQAPMASDVKPSEGTRKLVEGGTKKIKVQKRPAGELSSEGGKKKVKVQKRPVGELSSENIVLVQKKKKKRKKEISTEIGGDGKDSPLDVSKSAIELENVSLLQPHVPPPKDTNELDNQEDAAIGSSSSQSTQQELDFRKVELQMLVTDLRALALNPFQGQERSCPAVIKQVFLKFRSLVYQKSLVLSPPAAESEAANEGRLIAATAVPPPDRTKIVKPAVRLDDPTRGGRKRGPPDHQEYTKKKKKMTDVAGELKNKNKKLVDTSGDYAAKKKKLDNLKLLGADKKITVLQRSTSETQPKVTQHKVDVRESGAVRNNINVPKAVKSESSKRMERQQQPIARGAANKTMLVMKFPEGSALPSGAELRAKFARFGPLDHTAARVFWKSLTCRLVYLHRFDAEAALKFAVGSTSLFGNANVRCYLRDMDAQGEPEAVNKLSNQKEDEQRLGGAPPQPLVQRPQSVQQLKSCLKKPYGGEEGGYGNGRGSTTRVKFAGVDETNIKGENDIKNNYASFHEGAPSTNTLDINSSSKNLQKFIPSHHRSSITTTSTTSLGPGGYLQKYSINLPQPPPPISSSSSPSASSSSSSSSASFIAPHQNDISQQMLKLLTRCSDVVNSLNQVFGYVPYHPL